MNRLSTEVQVDECQQQLAAEREKLREERAKFHGDDYADMDAARNRILDLEQQLAAEREKRRIDLEHIFDLDRTIQQLREQLAAAQAAMADVRHAVSTGTNEDLKRAMRSMHDDTTALDVAIAAAQQPLVDLEHYREVIDKREATLEAAYENHRADIARREADYTRELNAKLAQINAQAKTIRELVDALKRIVNSTAEYASTYKEKANSALAKVKEGK